MMSQSPPPNTEMTTYIIMSSFLSVFWGYEFRS